MIIQMEQKMYELTNPQKSIWLTEQYFQNTTINNICGSLIIKQDTDLNILFKDTLHRYTISQDGTITKKDDLTPE